jgi:hypothetical protein
MTGIADDAVSILTAYAVQEPSAGSEKRETFVILPGHVTEHDVEGRATGWSRLSLSMCWTHYLGEPVPYEKWRPIAAPAERTARTELLLALDEMERSISGLIRTLHDLRQHVMRLP